MSRPTAISPEEQEQIARKIGVLLLQGAPEDWQEITVEYRATGEYTDLLGEMSAQDGSSRQLDPPAELREIFERLREGMYRPDVGTWLSALYVVERPSSYRIDINFDTEPQWQRPLPRAAYVDELRRYPRAEENIPDWMRERVEGIEPGNAAPQVPDSPAEVTAAQSATEQTGGFRFANVFDGVDDEGRPVVAERQPVPGDEVTALRQYLESAPVVLSARENEEDMLASDRDRSVPSSWHTDGTWVWAGAVAYYLAQYGLPPETALVDHVRSRGFQVGEVDEATREAVVRELTEQPADEPADQPVDGQLEEPEQAEAAAEEDAAIDEQLEEIPAATGSRHVLDEGDDLPDTQEVLAQLHDRLTAYRVDEAEYRIGSTSDEARCLVQDGEDWAVVGGGEDVRFARVDHAASFLLGRLLLDRPAPDADSAGIAAPAAVPAPDVPAPAPSEAPELSATPEPVVEPDEPAAPAEANDLPRRTPDTDLPQRTPEPELPQRGAPQTPAADLPPQEPVSDLPKRTPQEPAADLPPQEPVSDLPKRTPQEPAPKPSSSGPSTGGNPLFTANQEPGAPVPEPPSAAPAEEPPQAPAMDRPLPPQAPQSPPAGTPAQPSDGAAPGSAPLPKRQPRRDSGAPVPPPGAPAQGGQPQGGQPQGGQPQGGQPQGGPAQAQSGPAGAPPAPGGPGMSGPNRQGPPPAPPRPPQGGQPQGGQPQGGQPQGGQQPGQQPQQGQQIQPLNGEPPLTLYRDRRIVMLQPGTELDRFGEPNGNVLYTARTPYTHRSLPPQWSNRTYAAYRVQRPIQALRGTAVPWFEQPGGGTAFVLPGAVSDLLSDGTLAEMPANERPPME